MKTNSTVCVCLASFFFAINLVAAPLDTNKIEQVTGLKGTWNAAEKVFKISDPRDDIKVFVDKWNMPPFMGLTSWAAFTEAKAADAMVMGDLVLLQDEVNPVMSALFDSGLAVTALHNHFFFDEPKVFFMHISGEGTAEQLAGGLRKVFDKLKQIRKIHSPSVKNFYGVIAPTNFITASLVENILGTKGQSKDGMYKVVFGRSTKMPCGCEVGKEMGVNTWAAFGGLDKMAVVDGDFAVHEDELQAVLKALRGASINVVAIHNHMIGETPRTLFVHYWGKGGTENLAKGIKAALDAQKSATKK